MATEMKRCRVCLDNNHSRLYHDLSSNFPVYLNTRDSVSRVLEIVTSTLVPVSRDLPHEICSGCLKKLKEVWQFINDFKKNQKTLKNILSSEREETICKIVDVRGADAKGSGHNSPDEEKKQCSSSAEMVKSEAPSDEDNALEEGLESFDRVNDDYHMSDSEQTKAQVLEDQNFSDFSDDDAETIRIITLDESGSNGLSVAAILDEGKKKINAEVSENDDALKVYFKEKIHFACETCPRIFATRKGLHQHSKVHTPEFLIQLRCKICGHQNKSRSAFLHHKLKHNGIDITCEDCGKTVKTNWQLKEHKLRMHGAGLPEKFFCEECGKGFKYLNAHKYHMVAVHNQSEKAHQCQFCGFKCATKQHLKRHERCHTGERPYKCKYCDKTFRGTTERLKHEHIHDQIFNSHCKYCTKQFVNRWNMRVHMMQHRGNFQCGLCKYSFKDEEILQFHLRYRHMKKGEKIVKNEDPVEEEYFEHYESLDDPASVLEDYETFEEDAILD